MSKLNAAVKPEIYISWIPTGKVAVKPEIYISWIPAGKIGLKPQIYATVIPAPEKTQADLSRKVTTAESIGADILRHIRQSENISADTLREVVEAEQIISDTKRKLTAEEQNLSDLFRRVVYAEREIADIFREVKKNEITTNDTERAIKISEKISADLFLQIDRTERTTADIYREVKKAEKAIGDTSRKNGLVTISGDLQRKLEVTQKSNADTSRRVEATEQISGDTFRRAVIAESYNADTFRTIKQAEKFFVDTWRQVGVNEKSSADVQLRISRRESINADIFRKVEDCVIVVADTTRRIGVFEKKSAKTNRIIANAERTIADTSLQVTATEKAQGDLILKLREIVCADTFRQVSRTEKATASTVIRIPHVLNYFLQNRLATLNKPRLRNSSNVSLVDTIKPYGVTAINITLSEKTLSDSYTFSIAQPLEIEDTVQGRLLDYPFNFVVEETDQVDLVQTVTGRYNKDDQLYKWFRFNAVKDDSAESPVYKTAIEIMQDCAQYLGMTLDIKIDDFTPSDLDSDSTMTYADLLSNLFNWTSRLPQRQVNVFMRDNTLHVIQRGKEDSVFDITDLPHSRPNINKKLNRVLCFNPNTSDSDSDDENKGYRFSGTIYFSDKDFYIAYTYQDGFLVREQNSLRTDNVKNSSTTTYSYTTLAANDEGAYLSSKMNKTTAEETDENGDVQVTETSSSTTYHYNMTNSEIYLVAEYETITKTEYSKTNNDDKETSTEIKETFHTPAGNGWYTQTVYLNGVLQGANLSQGKPGNSVSPYIVDKFQEGFGHFVSIDNTEEYLPEDDLSLIIDVSFPVREDEIKDTLNEALRWLHRKIIKTVTVDLTSKVENGVPELDHIVDFTERVKLDGEEYFLVSNAISFVPEKLIQKLKLIRWY